MSQPRRPIRHRKMASKTAFEKARWKPDYCSLRGLFIKTMMPQTMTWTWAAARKALTRNLWKAIGRLRALLAAQKSTPVADGTNNSPSTGPKTHTNALALPAQSRWSEK